MAKGSALQKPVTVTPELAVIVGSKGLTRAKVTQGVWAYIKKHSLQDKKDGRIINPDEKLSKVLGKKPINMMKMTGVVSKHIEMV